MQARDEQRGLSSLKELRDKNLTNVNFHQLDIENIDSINTLASYIKNKYGGLDILINNAAILYQVINIEMKYSIYLQVNIYQ